jgi:hypothetical protein
MTRRRVWLLAPFLIIAFLAGAELSARLDDLVRYGVPVFASPSVGYDLVVRDSITIRGRPYGRFEKIRLNAAGFRGPPIHPVPPAGCVRVIVLGASESIVGGEDAGTEYPARMQDDLARYGCFEVQNAAVSGLDLCRITALWTNWAAKWSAQVVVVYPTPYFYVSPDPPEYPTTPLRPAGKPPWWTLRLPERWHDYPFAPEFVAKWQIRRDIARKLASHADGWEYQLVPADRLGLYERHLDSLVVAIQATGAEPVLVTHATKFPNQPAAEDELLMLMWEHNSRATARVLLDFEHAANAMMAAVGRRRGAMVVDAAAHMDGRRSWFTDFSHFSPEGRVVLGRLVADSVRSLVGRRIATRLSKPPDRPLP